jgi:hypothetical protein
MDVFVSLPRTDTFGNAVLEAFVPGSQSYGGAHRRREEAEAKAWLGGQP